MFIASPHNHIIHKEFYVVTLQVAKTTLLLQFRAVEFENQLYYR